MGSNDRDISLLRGNERASERSQPRSTRLGTSGTCRDGTHQGVLGSARVRWLMCGAAAIAEVMAGGPWQDRIGAYRGHALSPYAKYLGGTLPLLPHSGRVSRHSSYAPDHHCASRRLSTSPISCAAAATFRHPSLPSTVNSSVSPGPRAQQAVVGKGS